MPKQKVAVTLDRQLLDDIDELAAVGAYPNRSQEIEAAVSESLSRRAQARLGECALLDPAEEHLMAEQDIGADGVEWPTY